MTQKALVDINTNSLLREIQKLHQKIEAQGIQLSIIAAQMIEQNNKLHKFTSRTRYIGYRSLQEDLI